MGTANVVSSGSRQERGQGKFCGLDILRAYRPPVGRSAGRLRKSNLARLGAMNLRRICP